MLCGVYQCIPINNPPILLIPKPNIPKSRIYGILHKQCNWYKTEKNPQKLFSWWRHCGRNKESYLFHLQYKRNWFDADLKRGLLSPPRLKMDISKMDPKIFKSRHKILTLVSTNATAGLWWWLKLPINSFYFIFECSSIYICICICKCMCMAVAALPNSSGC